MKLLSFEIRDYRSCLRTSLTPKGGLTAIIGANSSGKSNLLNALLLLKKATKPSGRARSIETEYQSVSKIETDIDVDGRTVSLKGGISYVTNERNVDEVIGTDLKWNLEGLTRDGQRLEVPFDILVRDSFIMTHGGGRLSYEDMRTMIWHKGLEISSFLPKDMVSVAQKLLNYLENIRYYSASQFSDPSQCPVSLELEGDKLQPWYATPASHTQFIHDLYRAYERKATAYQRYLYIVGPRGMGLIDNVQFKRIPLSKRSIEVRSGGKTTRRMGTQLIVVPTFTVGGNRLSPNQLSEGTFKTLALLFYVLTDESDLLLVEEPEACIHHGLLKGIMTIIKEESANKQFIISTHSDYVLDQLEPENVVLIDRNNLRGTRARAVSSALSRADFKALKSYLAEEGSLGEYWRSEGFLDE